MRAYIIKRLLLAILTLILLSFLIFALIRFIPGTIVDAIIGQQVAMGEGGMMDIESARATIEAALGLDHPFLEQYGRWIGNIVLHGDLGNSLWRGTPVLDEIVSRWPVTIELSLLGLIIGQLIALPIGVFSALRQDTIGDYVARSFAIGCIALPGFWVGTMVIVFPAMWWGYMPSITFIPFAEDPLGNLKMFIVPATVLGMAMTGGTMRMTRTMMLEVLRQDYIRTAWAKGLRERAVVLRHALKNALIPVITYIGLWIAFLMGGTVIIEEIFCLPGMGHLFLDAIKTRDYTLVSGAVVLFGVALVLINLMVDLAYGFLDPKVHYK